MRAIKIISIGQVSNVNTTYGLKQKVNLIVQDASTPQGQEIKTSWFLPKEGIWFNAGDTVLADLVQNGVYWNIKKIECMGEPIAPIVQNIQKEVKVVELPKSVEPVDWDGKERRMVRMNSLSHATELVKHDSDMDLNDKAKFVTTLAEIFELWIYRK